MNSTSTTELPSSKDSSRSHSSVLVSFSLGVFWVLFLWGFWEKEMYAVGANASVFLLLFLFFVNHFTGKKIFFRSQDLIWQVPLYLVIVSYAMYDTPFIKYCNVLFFPIVISLIVWRALAVNPEQIWRAPYDLIRHIAYSLTAPCAYIVHAVKCHLDTVLQRIRLASLLKNPTVVSCIKGGSILGGLLLFLILPLLSSMDSAFQDIIAHLFDSICDWLLALFEEQLIIKSITIGVISVWSFASLSAWSAERNTTESARSSEGDSVRAGIILSGILIVYLLFLFVQIERLWLTLLPSTFEATEAYVKSGFWQLVILSALNIGLTYIYFRRTTPVVQTLLVGFVIASLMLILSGAHRMYLYVLYYGLSHEKWYASYTVLYCLIVFILLLVAFFRPGHHNIIKQSVGVLIWMYGVVSIFPVERTIAHVNLAIAQRADSRCALGDLVMLSSDALPVLRAHADEIRAGLYAQHSWPEVNRWISRKERKIQSKSWYEHTLSSLVGGDFHNGRREPELTRP